MTFTMSFRSMISGRVDDDDAPPVVELLSECRDGIAPAELAVPVALLRQLGAAQWCREHEIGVEVHSMGELFAAVAADIDPRLLTVDVRGLNAGDLAGVGELGVARVIVDDVAQLDRLAGCAGGSVDVVVQQPDRDALDEVVDRVLARPALRLIGVRRGGDPAVAAAAMIEQLDHIRRRRGCLLTRVYLDGVAIERRGATGRRAAAMAAEVYESVTDACVRLRFPRPMVVIGLDRA